MFFKQQGHKLSLAFNLIGQHAVLVLLGKEIDTMTIDGLSTSVNDNPSPRLIMTLYVTFMLLFNTNNHFPMNANMASSNHSLQLILQPLLVIFNEPLRSARTL